MEKYENVEMEIIFFDNVDIVCASGEDEVGGSDYELPPELDSAYELHGQRP